MPNTASEFERATKYVQSMPKGESTLSNEDKLAFYANYKQATVGTCKAHGGAQPWSVQFEARAKWDAWNALGERTADEAKKAYVAALDKADKDWRSKATQ